MGREARHALEQPRSGTSSPRLYYWALVLLIALVYGQTATFDFVNFDDQEYVTQNERVLDGLSPASIRWAFLPTGYAANWHPLVWLSLMLDAEMFGTWAGGFHLTNVLLHAANSLLVFGLLNRITGETARSFVVAGFFAVHPLHVESVAWVTERKDMLSTLFAMLSICAYVQYTAQSRKGWYLAAWGCLLLSLMSKQMFVTLPCVLLLLDFWPLERLTPVVRRVAEKLPLAVLCAAFCFVVLWAQRTGGAVHTLDRIPLDVRLANAVVSYVAYLGQTFWPVNLAVFYPYPTEGRHWPQVAAGLALLAGITIGIVRQRRQRPYLLMGWLWYLITLLPVIGIVQVGDQSRADRYMYFPLIGLLIAVTWLAADLLRAFAKPRVTWVMATVLLLASCGLAWNQTRHWRNSIALFEHAIAVTNDNWLAHTTLAAALMDTPGRLPEALVHLQESLRIKPTNPTAHYNLALVLSDMGDLAGANPHFREALALKPDHLRARLLLCLNLKRLGLVDELSRELAAFDAQHPSPPPEIQPALDSLRIP